MKAIPLCAKDGTLRAEAIVDDDHINRDRLDNRRSNLRIVTRAENRQNVGPHRGSASRFRGVSWDREKSKWRVIVCHDGTRHDLGRFADEEHAARIASAFRAKVMPFSVEDAA